MTTSNPSGPQSGGGERKTTVDFDLFGDGEHASEAAIAAQALEKTAGQVDFDVFGTAEAPAEPPPAAAPAENVDFDIFGAEAAAAAQETITVLPDDDMDADDATRFTSPPTPGEAAAAAPFVAPKAAPTSIPAPARAAAPAPAPAPAQKSGTGKLVAIVIVIVAIAVAAWWFLR